MDRKVKSQTPARHQLLYDIIEFGIVKFLLIVWAICWVILGITIAGLKWFVNHFK